jgi:hypothetical protein
MNRNYIKRHITTFSIIVFLILYGLINFLKPAFVYNTDGSLRDFGVGFRKTTVIPAWLLAIILAILSYYAVLYYIAAPKIKIY